jgi:hypothetical protein
MSAPKMTLRHAAAFVLVGWYLMMPTFFTITSHGTILSPKKRLTFDSYEACRSYKQDLIGLRKERFSLPGFVVAAKCTQFEDRLAN